MLYPNLEAEMARFGVTQLDIASTLGKSPATICGWMNGTRGGDFTIQDAATVKRELFPGDSNITLEYLFERNEKTVA